jgi:hypothetical protein
VTLHATAPVYIGVDRMPLTLSAIQLSHVSASHTRFLKDVLANIIADTILASPAMLGSLEVGCWQCDCLKCVWGGGSERAGEGMPCTFIQRALGGGVLAR